MAKQHSEVADIDRSLYDFRYGEEGFERLDAGLTPEIVREISAKKDEPEWMLEFRLKSLEIYKSMSAPDWGPSIAGLDMDNIVTYVKPNTDQKSDWESLPDDVKNTFDRLGIPQAERAYLAGVGAQYDSELVYHNMQDTASKMGIVYSGIEEALHDPKWEPLIREKFMTLIPPTDHKFAALHGAVWSGGSFVYVPKDTKLDFPLQSYFRLNAKGAGQFEHTLIIVEDGADLHFIEGCSAPKYNVANLHAGAVRWQKRAPALFDHRELVEEHVQPEHETLGMRRGRINRMGFGQLRQPCRLPLSHVYSFRAQVDLHFHGHYFRRPGPKPRYRLQSRARCTRHERRD